MVHDSQRKSSRLRRVNRASLPPHLPPPLRQLETRLSRCSLSLSLPFLVVNSYYDVKFNTARCVVTEPAVGTTASAQRLLRAFFRRNVPAKPAARARNSSRGARTKSRAGPGRALGRILRPGVPPHSTALSHTTWPLLLLLLLLAVGSPHTICCPGTGSGRPAVGGHAQRTASKSHPPSPRTRVSEPASGGGKNC